MAIKIQVLGTGCAKCADLAKNAESAARVAGVAFELEKVTDVQKIMAFGVMTTPGLVIDGKVVSSGKVLGVEEIATILKSGATPAPASASACCSSGCSCGSGDAKEKADKSSCACGPQGSGCACGPGSSGGGCCGGSSLRLWIFPLLAVAVAGVLWMKGTKHEAAFATPAGASGSGVPATGEIRAVPAVKPLPKLVDLGAVGCKPCKIMDGVLEELRKGYPGKLAVEFINVRTEEAKAEPYKIDLIPTQIWLDASGKELFRHVGVISAADIAAKFKELGVDLGAPVAGAAAPATEPAAADDEATRSP